VGHDLAREIRAIGEDDVAMEILGTGRRGPFVADERRESAGLVPALEIFTR
jgi:hypothetical protein